MAPNAAVTLSVTDLSRLVRILQIIAVALLASQLFFLGIVVLLHQVGAFPRLLEPTLFYGIASIVTASGLFGAIVVTNRIVRLRDGSEERLLRLRRATSLVIVRLAVLEGAGIANIVFFLLTADLLFLGAFAACVMAFITFRPTSGIFEAFRDSSGPPPIG